MQGTPPDKRKEARGTVPPVSGPRDQSAADNPKNATTERGVQIGLPSKPMSSGWQRVGAGLSVSFTWRAEQLSAEWMPRTPTKREWKRVIGRYRGHRDHFLSGLGVGVAVIEHPAALARLGLQEGGAA